MPAAYLQSCAFPACGAADGHGGHVSARLWRAVAVANMLRAADARQPTQFQIACMTLPYARFPLARALEGIKAAGYRYVAWGTTHEESAGQQVPVMPQDAAAGEGP